MTPNTPQLTDTVQLLQGGLAGVANGGMAHLEGWIAALEGNHQLMGTYNELVLLHQDLLADAPNVARIHEHLDTLARFTERGADAADAQAAPALRELAEGLRGLAVEVR